MWRALHVSYILVAFSLCVLFMLPVHAGQFITESCHNVMQAIATDSPNEATDFLCRQLHIPYFRFNPRLSEKIDLKEVRTEKLVKLVLETRQYCNEMAVRDQLAHAVQLLHAASRANKSEAMYRSNVSDIATGKE